MFIKNHQMVFLLFMMLSTVMAVSSNSWFVAWLGIEINLMSIIPLILSELNFKSTESAIKYFLAQALASIVMVTVSVIQSIFETSYLADNSSSMIFLALAIKTGLAPFHMWFPMVVSCVSWWKCFLVMVWQKIAPFILMAYFFSKPFASIVIFISAITGAAGGVNQTSSKLLLSYSSIAHSAWMVVTITVSVYLWTVYFSVYSLILAPIMHMFFKTNLEKISEINKSKLSSLNKNLLAFLVLSLGGLPPFLGFTAKLTTLIAGMTLLPMFIFLTLVMSSLVSLYFYLKMFFNLLAVSSIEKKIYTASKNWTPNNFLTLSVAGNLLMSILVLLI